MSEDIRWRQRLANFEKALSQLADAIELGKQRSLSRLEQQGLIQGFGYTHELAWNTMKDSCSYQGPVEITGSRDAIREAFKRGLIVDGHTWMDMIRGRNMSSHTYNKTSAQELVEAIVQNYFPMFVSFRKKMFEISPAQN